jgi:chorismate lyase/3-hydroxybenzoate synthase
MGELRLALNAGADLYVVAQQAYARIFDWLSQRPGWTLWRVWHYFPDIHAGIGDEEPYRRFVSGRHAEFARQQLPLSAYPAATVIGSASGGLVMHFIAGRAATVVLENPRQVSAFCYPRQYGQHSPSFARARHLRSSDFGRVPLLVSGTSSVVGHRSTHAGDWQAQLRDTQINLRTLVAQCSAPLQPQSLRLYLTSQVPATPARQQLHDFSQAAAPLMTLQGDVCRDDLSLEIEGVWGG